MQGIGLVDNVLPHTTPWHAMRFLTPKGRCFADIQPMTDEFGWSRLNAAFIQPRWMPSCMKDFSVFPMCAACFLAKLKPLSESDDGVTLIWKGPAATGNRSGRLAGGLRRRNQLYSPHAEYSL